jgi:polysaccharide chain length determinant protein (PEP-CTERM system associated)
MDRELTLADYRDILRRRYAWLMIPTLVVPVVVFLISLKLPERYVSQTLVLVEQQKVPDSFVKPVVNEDLAGRLATMQEQILSRTRLQPIIERFGLYKNEGLSADEMVDRMRKSIVVTPIKQDPNARAGSGMPGFYVSFTASSARMAQQVCGEIVSMFLTENLKVREQSAQGTTDFLRNQLQDAKQALDEQDAKLAAFQKRYVGQLPGEQQTNFSLLGSLNAQLEATNQNLNQLEQQKTYTETLLTAQEGNSQTTASGESPHTLQQQIDATRVQLYTAEAKYTPQHPDVIRLKKDLETLQARAAEVEARATDAKSPKAEVPAHVSDQILQLRAQLKSLEQAVRDKKAEQQHLKDAISGYQSRLEQAPAVDQQMKTLTRDYQTALQFYNDLLAKKNQSEMATDLERRQQGEQFSILDPPNLPDAPTFPNRPLLTGAGLGGGLALGLCIVAILEMRESVVRTERDVKFYLALPTLATVPDLSRDRPAPKNKAAAMPNTQDKAPTEVGV